MDRFDIIAQIKLENRFVVERRADETFEQAVLRQINDMSAAECKALFTSGELSIFHVDNTPAAAIRLIVNEKLDPDDDRRFLDDLVEKINKDMSVAAIAERIADETSINTWNSFGPEECVQEAERMLHLLHQLK